MLGFYPNQLKELNHTVCYSCEHAGPMGNSCQSTGIGLIQKARRGYCLIRFYFCETSLVFFYLLNIYRCVNLWICTIMSVKHFYLP